MILIVTRILPHHSIGGMQEVAFDLAKELVRQGVECSILTTSIPEHPERFVAEGVEIIGLKSTSPGIYSKNWWKSSIEYFEENFLGKADHIISVSSSAKVFLDKKDVYRVPISMQCHGTSLGEIKSKWRTKSIKKRLSIIKNLIWLFRDRNTFRRYDKIIAVGKMVFEDLKRPFFKIQDDQLLLIENGIDTGCFNPHKKDLKLFKRLGLREDDFIVTISSRITKEKGIKESIQYFLRLMDLEKNLKLLIIGEGDQFEAIKDYIESDNYLRGKTILLGRQTRGQIAAYLAISDLFVFLTLRVEVGITLTLMEALSCGVPAVISKKIKLSEDIDGVFYDDVALSRVLDFAKSIRENSRASLLPFKYRRDFMGNEYINKLDLK